MIENLVKFSNEGFMLVASVARGGRHILILCSSRQYPYPRPASRRATEIQRGSGGRGPKGRNFRGVGFFFSPYRKLTICDKQLIFAQQYSATAFLT